MPELKNLRVAILTENGFEQSELTSPKEAMEKAGVTVEIVSPQSKEVKAWDVDNWGITIPVDVTLDQAKPENYDGLMLPGGVFNPDKLRMNQKAVDFVKHFLQQGKPVAAICHGPQTLIETEMIEGKSAGRKETLGGRSAWEFSPISLLIPSKRAFGLLVL